MDYSSLDPEYLQRLDNEVLLHTAQQYSSVVKVLQESDVPTSPAMLEHVSRCLSMVCREMDRRGLDSTPWSVPVARE